MGKHWACQSIMLNDIDFSGFAGKLGKRIAGHSLPRTIARLTPTKVRERPTRIGRQWVFPLNPIKSRQNELEFWTSYTSRFSEKSNPWLWRWLSERPDRRSDLTTSTGELGIWRAQVNIRALFPCLEISFVRILTGSYGEENLVKVFG